MPQMSQSKHQSLSFVKKFCVRFLAFSVFVCGALTSASPIKLKSIREFHHQYNNIFKYGNRNAASHKWANFLLKDSTIYTNNKLIELFSGFCPISGSPVTPNNFNRYGLKIPVVDGLQVREDFKARFGFLHYCCWPCVCDTQDFLRIDSLTIKTKDNPQGIKHYFVVIGNPCVDGKRELLRKPFFQPFDRGYVTLEQQAPEVKCDALGNLEDAIMSDHGFVVIGMFFNSHGVNALPDRYKTTNFLPRPQDGMNQPGRMSYTPSTNIQYQEEEEYDMMCLDRKNNGYNSGMGEIFRKVAEINKIEIQTGMGHLALGMDGDL